MGQSGKIQDIEKYRRGVYKREEESTTGIGEGIAIPHCKSDAVIKPGLAAMVIPDGVEFDSLDGEPVKIIVFNCSAGYKGECTLRCFKQIVGSADGRKLHF